MIPDACVCTALHAATAGMHVQLTEILVIGAALGSAGVGYVVARRAERRAVRDARLPIVAVDLLASRQALHVQRRAITAKPATPPPGEPGWPRIVGMATGGQCRSCDAGSDVAVQSSPQSAPVGKCWECLPGMPWPTRIALPAPVSPRR